MKCCLRAVVCFLLQVFGVLGAKSLAKPKGEACRQLCDLLERRQMDLIKHHQLWHGMNKCLEDCLKKRGKVTTGGNTLALHPVRARRAIPDPPQVMSCKETFESRSTYNYLGLPQEIQATFQKHNGTVNGSDAIYWTLNITWSPLPVITTPNNWTHYLVIWFVSGDRDRVNCELVPRNQSMIILPSANGWDSPPTIHLNITTYPMRGNIHYKFGFEAIPLSDFPNYVIATLPPDVSFNRLTAILVGVFVGILLVISIIGLIVKKKRSEELKNVWITHLKQLPNEARERIRSTQSQLTIVEDENHYYVSYFPENEEYVRLVVRFVEFLRELYYDVKMDKMCTDLPQEGPNRWAQRQISTSTKIIALCSPSYLKLCQKSPNRENPQALLSDEESRVWYEIELLGTIYTQRRNANKMVCIWMNNGVPEGLPPWLQVRYTWPADCDKIFARLDDVSA